MNIIEEFPSFVPFISVLVYIAHLPACNAYRYLQLNCCHYIVCNRPIFNKLTQFNIRQTNDIVSFGMSNGQRVSKSNGQSSWTKEKKKQKMHAQHLKLSFYSKTGETWNTSHFQGLCFNFGFEKKRNRLVWAQKKKKNEKKITTKFTHKLISVLTSFSQVCCQ